jgi:hypothetical protein
MAWTRLSYPQWLLIGLVVVLGGTLLISAATSTAAFGAYNSAWDGTSEVRATATEASVDPILVQNTSAYERYSANTSLAVVLSPTEAYSPRETQRLAQFVRAGGTVLIADDYREHSNPLLAAIGADARIDPVPLRDERRAGPTPAFPLATPATNTSVTRNVSELMLNHGGTIQPNGATVLFASSPFSYRDTTRDETLNDAEQLRQHPVVTSEPVGDGRVIVVSDASLFVNAMVSRADNGVLLTELVTPHERVLLDLSHTAGVPPLIAAQLFLQDTGVAAFFGGVLSLLALVLWPFIPAARDRLEAVEPQVDRPARDASEVAAGLRARHPKWDPDRIERVTDRLMTQHQQRRDDD